MADDTADQGTHEPGTAETPDPAPDHGDHHHSHHGHGDHHGHGHHNDQGWRAMLRYLRHGRRMWNSEINEAVIALIGPTPGERGLDVGAGVGAGAMLAAATGARVVAVEPTPYLRRMLIARTKVSRHGGRVEVVDGTAERIPADDDSVDVLWAVNTMHHWLDPETAASEIARVLRPTGRLVLVDEDFADPSHPDFEAWGKRHGPRGKAEDKAEEKAEDKAEDQSDDNDANGSEGERGHGPEHHGFTMVEAEAMGRWLTAAGLDDIVAGNRRLDGRPVIAVTKGVAG